MSLDLKTFEDLTLGERLTMGAVLLLIAGVMAQIEWPNPYVEHYLGRYRPIILITIVVVGLTWFQRNAPDLAGSNQETQDAPSDER